MSFSTILDVDLPEEIACDPTTRRNVAFTIRFTADGEIPLPQVILWEGCIEHLFARNKILPGAADHEYTLDIPAGELPVGTWTIQIEGCRRDDFGNAGNDDWIKRYVDITVLPPQDEKSAPETQPESAETETAFLCAPSPDGGEVKLYFAIHKHMHQPYYNTTDRAAWDGEKDEIFGSRQGPYARFIPAAVRQYIDGGLPHAGLSTSWSGSLIEQLDRCAREGLCGGGFSDWSRELRELAGATTACGNPRIDFSGFGFYHPLMALIPARDIVKQIRRHAAIIESAFGGKASPVLFPPETAFHVRMIPALKEAGIDAVIYDSIHRFRTCKDYPYAGSQEGMLPPNRAEQENPRVTDWLQLHNIWAGSKISPSLLRPEYLRYEDPDGTTHSIIGVPAERYIGNEDARGGFGALQYPDVLGQVYDAIVRDGNYDPAHPPFFVLHSDGDNHGGGAESYYTHNTGQLVEWQKRDPRFELTTIRDYLERFPPDPAQAVHLEPGSWSGADNGDPQFMKWFSRYREDYSPDLNSWAVLTALQNAVHTLEDAGLGNAEAEDLMLTAETSCYWYWTGQDVWDGQVTAAANKALGIVSGALDGLLASGKDTTDPTIFAPWVLPENPGGQTWGDGGLKDAPREGTVHTFVHDVSGLKRVDLVLRTASGESTLPMKDNGAYPSRTGATAVAHLFTCQLPTGAGDVRYFIEAEDTKGNFSRSALERVFLA